MKFVWPPNTQTQVTPGGGGHTRLKIYNVKIHETLLFPPTERLEADISVLRKPQILT